MSKKLNDLVIKEEDITELLKQIRISLLDADVNLLVVKDFIKNIRTKAVGQSIPYNADPQQFMLTLIKDELIEILGKQNSPVNFNHKQTRIMMVGLNGHGKTTTTAKIANYAKNKLSKKPLLVGLDVYRPAAIEQLQTLSGIGESKAQAIIDYRNEFGNFKSIEDILNVSGIGESIYEKIKNNITV